VSAIWLLGANGITQATPIYFLIAFVITFGGILLEYSLNILEKFSKTFNFLFNKSLYYFIKVHVKNLAKICHFQKN
jgi:hypothetical protein